LFKSFCEKDPLREKPDSLIKKPEGLLQKPGTQGKYSKGQKGISLGYFAGLTDEREKAICSNSKKFINLTYPFRNPY